jgi:arginyl-tRNA synthetase
MKQQLKTLIEQSLQQLQHNTSLPTIDLPDVQIDHARDKQFGDYACNIAMILAKSLKMNPRVVAELIVGALPASTLVKQVNIAGPGFINFVVTDQAKFQVLHDIFTQKQKFGRTDIGKDQRVHIEFVSANPTGPLHVGHGRSAAFGAVCCNLMEAIGINVHREYYVNDAGRQMNILATSVWLRYLELCGEQFTFPSNGYKGQYIKEIAQGLFDEHGKQFQHAAKIVFADIAPDAKDDGTGDKEAHIDGLIERCKTLLGDDYHIFHQRALQVILDDIRDDLADFGVTYTEWFAEASLFKNNLVYIAIEKLKASGHTYEKEGNLWFNSTAFGDDKDRVLIRKNGDLTYFAVDITYHLSKFERGATHVIDVLGADHHGYYTRIAAALQALGIDANKLSFLFIQFATLFRSGERAQMSTRSGEFVTLRELRDEVGNDAARFFYVMRKNEQHLEFDLDLAKSESSDNPVYYIQYAHARICSVERQLKEKGWQWDATQGLAHVELLQQEHEKALLETIAKYPEVIVTAAKQYEPHMLAQYLRQVAMDLHSYYNALPFLVDDSQLRNARLALVFATRQVLVNGSQLLGISTPEVM